jgi:hypothetical protein
VQKPLNHWGEPSGEKAKANAIPLAGLVQRLLRYFSFSRTDFYWRLRGQVVQSSFFAACSEK